MWTVKPRLVSLSSDRKAKLLVTVILLGLLFITAANRPFSSLYKYVHPEKDLSKTAENLNRHRTQAAKEYFVSARNAGSRQEENGQQARADQEYDRNAGSRQLRNGQEARSDQEHDRNAGSRQLGNGQEARADQEHDSLRQSTLPAQARVTVAIVSVRRKSSAVNLGYVIQSAAALDSLLRQQGSDDLFGDSILFVCNVDDHPERHSDAAFLKDHVAFVERYGVSSAGLGLNLSMAVPGMHGQSYREVRHHDVYDKERYDYMFCLQAAMAFRPHYVLIVEDDALALPDMPSVVQHALRRLTSTLATPVGHRDDEQDGESLLPLNPCASDLMSAQGLNGDERGFRGRVLSGQTAGFVYLKLFFPLYWQGFAFELLRILDLVCMTAVLTSVFVVVLQMTVSTRGFPPNRIIGAIFVFSLILCELIGRQNLNEMRRFSKHFYRLQQSPDCCTPAMLYPCDIVPALLTSLSRCRAQRHVDLCIADFVKRSGLPAYSLEPNLFSHVGMVTSLNMNNKHAEELLFHSKITQFSSA